MALADDFVLDAAGAVDAPTTVTAEPVLVAAPVEAAVLATVAPDAAGVVVVLFEAM